VRTKLSPSSGGPRPGFAGVTKLAIYRYHGSGSADAAREHLRTLLARFRSEFMKAEAEANLDAYIGWCLREIPAVAARKARLNFDLGSGVILGGEVSRVDVDIASGGYRAVLLGDAPAGWQRELRVPLIQRAIGRGFNRDERDVRVGFQRLDGSNLEVVRFATAELDAAERLARELARVIAREWLAQGGL
jgi:hypothetical protein